MNRTTWSALALSFLLVMSVIASDAITGKRLTRMEVKKVLAQKEQKKVKKSTLNQGKLKLSGLAADKVRSLNYVAARAEGQDVKTLLSEDFSKFTAGTEAAPDATDIADMETGEIPSSYTQLPYWNGAAVYQAGGVAYMGMFTGADGEETGFIASPLVDLSANKGVFTVSFRARSSSPAGDTAYLVWVDNDTEEYDGAGLQLTNEWKTFAYTVEGAGTVNSFIQLYAMETPAYFDDIVITTMNTNIDIPRVSYPTNVTPTGFTANWMPVSTATSYLLSVYSYQSSETGVPVTTVTEGFDQLVVKDKKFIDTDKTTWPEGWTIDVMKNGTSRHIYNTSGNYQSAPLSLAFDATGDVIVTPKTTAPITSFSFWVKNQMGDQASSVMAEGFDGTNWIAIGKVIPALIEGEASVIGVNEGNMPAGIVQLRLTYTKGAGNCSIDDVTYTYGGSIAVKEYLFNDKEVTGTSYDVTGLTAGVQYYYTVKAKNDKFVSGESDEMKAQEVLTELPVPVTKEATNISETGFTANWEAVDKAEGYAVYSILKHKAAADENYMLANEDFSKIDFGTVEEPEQGGLTDYLDDYTNRCDWMAVMPAYASGMLGLDNSLAMLGLPGTLFSPAFDLSHNGGAFTVDVTVKGVNVTSVAVAHFAGDIEEPVETQDATITGETQVLHFEFAKGTSASYIAVMVMEGDGILFIDDIKVSQNLKAGESTALLYTYGETDATTYTFSTPDKTVNDGFSFKVMAYAMSADGEDVISSDFSEPRVVEYAVSIENISSQDIKVYVNDNLHIDLTQAATVEVYTPAGVSVAKVQATAGNNRIALPSRGVYLVKVDGQLYKVVK